MKFDYKKVTSVFASAVMLSSTMGFAAAANYPTPFTDGAALVYGTNAASSDMAAAIQIYDQLKSRASTTTENTITGEAKAVETASQKLYLGDLMNNTKKSFTKDELPTVLADGKLTGSDGKEYKYEQKIDVPNSKAIYGDTPANLATPVVYADFDSQNYYFDLRVIFPTAVDPSNLTDEQISLFGKSYVFSGTASSLTNSSLTLFEKSTPVIVNDGESVTADGHTITVAVEDADTASITIDGTTASKDEGWSGKIGGVEIYVKNVVGPNVAGTSRYVELYLNSNKLILDNGDEVTLGSETVDGTSTTISSTGTKITEIRIRVIPYQFDDARRYLKLGDKLTDPVFKTVKLNLASVNPELEAETRDNIVIKPSGEKKVSLEFTNKAGKRYSLDVLKPSSVPLDASRNEMYNTTCTTGNTTHCTTAGTHTYNATTLGIGTDYDLIATTSGSANENDYFMTCSNEYTQIWEIKDINPSDTKVKVQDAGTGSSSVEISLSSKNNGSTASLTLADGNSATITLVSNVTASEAINISSACSYLYTKKGAKIDLSYANAITQNTSQIRISQETAYNGGDFKNNAAGTLGDKNITVRFDYYASSQTGKDMKIRDVLGGPTDGTEGTDFWAQDVGDYDYYYLTEYGTFVKRTGDTDKQVEIWYPEDAMSVGFYIGEETSEITPGTTGVSGGQISIVKDSEVDSVKGKHLIVVGGSCVNSVAARMLGSEVPICGADFTAKTDVSAGGYIIQVMKSPYNENKIAMLVAGYNAEDTTTASKRAMVIDGVNTAVGTKEIFPVVA
jgi:hypothetical protein